MTKSNLDYIRVAKIDDLHEIVKIEKHAGFNPRPESHIIHSLQHHQVWVIGKDRIISGFAVFQTIFG